MLRLALLGSLLLLATGIALAAEYNGTPVESTAAALFSSAAPAKAPAEPLSAEQLSSRIDALLGDAWKSAGIAPAPQATDEEFVRRVYLDLIGRIPGVTETLSFLDDHELAKRQRLVDDLLERGAWAAHFANTWRDLLLAGSPNQQLPAQSSALEAWLRLRFVVNVPYDQIVRELLTSPIQTSPVAMGEPSPAAFYQAAEFKPELLAASSSRVFLGIQLQCAQCHDHPFAAWKREQFWQYAAFFNNVASEAAKPDGAEMINIPDTKITVSARFLDGSSPAPAPGETKRAILARWTVDRSNALFAHAAVNRLWEHFFGRGIVHPVDHLDGADPPSQPELFDELARQFVLHGYDLKYLIRAITLSQAYQRSSLQSAAAPNDHSEQQSQLFARLPLRRMTADQLYASFVEATGFQPSASVGPLETSARDDFQARFSDTSVPATDAPTTILQALALMNGKYVVQATDLKQSKVLSAIAEAPYLDRDGRIELLFVAALSRRPDAQERQQVAAHIANSNVRDEKAALADVFWSLLNSAEFVLNH